MKLELVCGICFINHCNMAVVQELETLLANANVPSPYILVGHSIGGYYIRVFADRNPDKVQGLVFIASSHEDQAKTVNQEQTFSQKISTSIQKNIMQATMQTGLLRLATTINPEYFGFAKKNLPVNRALLFSQVFGTTNANDDFNGTMQSIDQVAEVDDLGNLPIRVITDKTEHDGDKFERQEDLASLSTNNKLISVPEANHYIHVTQPQAVIDQVLELISTQ